jgi:hypothetical protein
MPGATSATCFSPPRLKKLGFIRECVPSRWIGLSVSTSRLYYDDSTPTQDFSYPSLDHVRFFLVTFHGVRVIETDLAAVTERRGKYSTLFDLAQEVIGQLRMVSDEPKK